MEISSLLAKIFGSYLLVASAMALLATNTLVKDAAAMFNERFARLLAAMFGLLSGITFIHIYHDYTSFGTSLISLLGWFLIVKGVVYAFLPTLRLAPVFHMSERAWYVMDGALALLVGTYFLGFGYGLW